MNIFISTYASEQDYSHIKKIINPHRSHLIDDHLHRVLRSGTNNFDVEIEKMVNKIQQQKSRLMVFHALINSTLFYRTILFYLILKNVFLKVKLNK